MKNLAKLEEARKAMDRLVERKRLDRQVIGGMLFGLILGGTVCVILWILSGIHL